MSSDTMPGGGTQTNTTPTEGQGARYSGGGNQPLKVSDLGDTVCPLGEGGVPNQYLQGAYVPPVVSSPVSVDGVITIDDWNFDIIQVNDVASSDITIALPFDLFPPVKDFLILASAMNSHNVVLVNQSHSRTLATITPSSDPAGYICSRVVTGFGSGMVGISNYNFLSNEG